MAKMIPSNLEEFTTEGEGRFYQFVEKVAKPDSQFLCWYCPDINGREPDFVLFSQQTGLFIFEVKDWALDQVRVANSQYFELSMGVRTERKKSPYHQAREYLEELRVKIKADGHFMATDPMHAGSLSIPINYGVVFPNIAKHEYVEKGYGTVISPDRILFWDDLHPQSEICLDTSGQCFLLKLQSMSPFKFGFSLSNADINRLRKVIFPEVRIELPERGGKAAYLDHIQRVKMLDSLQEAIARRYDTGHHIIIGPSGSGKTLVLVHKAAFLFKYNPSIKHILFVCFNITLVNYLKRLLADKGVPLGKDGVEVLHFFELCSKILGEEIHYEKEDLTYYQTVTGLTLDRLRELSPQYDAILVDEGQDFSDDMYNVITSLLNKKTNNLTIALDDNQTIYTNRQSWKELGIQAKGRVHRISNIYRNTEEISNFAKKFKGSKGEVPKEKTQPELFEDFFEYHGPRPEIKRFPNVEEIASFVADKVKKLHNEDGYPYSDIAIIYTIRAFDGNAAGTTLPKIFQAALESKGIMSNWISEDYRSKKSYDITTNSVTISTIHSSKGLDYACVFLVGLDLLKPGDPWSEEQIHSLTYVGLTRARYHLIIPYANETPVIAKLRSSL